MSARPRAVSAGSTPHRAPVGRRAAQGGRHRAGPPRHARVPHLRLRRQLAIGATLGAVGLGIISAPVLAGSGWIERDLFGPVAALPSDNPQLGLVYQGLEPARDGAPCVGAYQLADPQMCSHGPDQVPPGLRVARDVAPVARVEPVPALPRRDTSPAPQERDVLADVGASAPAEHAPALAPAGAALGSGATITLGSGGAACDGDGRGGARVQLLYAYEAGVASRFSRYLASFRRWAAGVDAIFDASAEKTGGSRHVRYVTSAVAGGACEIDVREVQLPAGALANLNTTISGLRTLGFDRTDRKYLVFADSNVYCGIGTFARDDSAGRDNRNNRGPSYGRIDSGCWTAVVAAHELAHNLGGVQDSAPNSSDAGHCIDDYDLMCYPDTGAAAVSVVCPDRTGERLLDCDHDDYFSTNPVPGSYLATHWNVADSDYLLDARATGEASPAAQGVPPSQPGPVPTPSGAGTPPTPTPGPGRSAPARPGPRTAPPPGATKTSRNVASGLPAPGPTAGAATQPPRPPSPGALLATDTTGTSTLLGWPSAGAGTRYSVLVDGRAVGGTTANRVRVVGLRPDTAYRMRIVVRGAGGAARTHTATVSVRTAPATPPAPGGGWFLLDNALTSSAAGVYGARTANGTPLVLGPRDGVADQQWRAQRVGEGRYLLRSRATGKCVVPMGTAVPGAIVIQQECLAGDSAQHWRVVPSGHGFTLATAGSNLVIGVSRLRYGGERLLVLQRPAATRYQSWAAMPA